MSDLWLPPNGKRASPTLLAKLDDCPSRCWKEMVKPKEPTDAMLRGKVEHCLLLEPHTFDRLYRWAPEGRRGTKKWDEAEAAAIADGVTLIPAHWREDLEAMAAAITADPDASELFNYRLSEEIRLEWTDAHTGVGCCCVIDGYTPPDLWDLKTVASAAPHALQGALAKGWYIQLAMNIDALRDAGHPDSKACIIAVENAGDYEVCVAPVDEAAITFGRETYRRLLHLWRQCWEAEHWPGYGRQPLSLPRWKIAEIEMENANVY